MALILNIDTATEYASVCISNDENIIAEIICEDQKNHASFIQPAIDTILKENNITFQNLDAIAVCAGPGSYTGLRVGLSTAKGLCYALSKPLILCNTLKVIASAAMQNSINEKALYCPMIDARRMEVFTALYTSQLEEILPPQAMILTDESFADQLNNNKIIFSGNGSNKFESLMGDTQGQFIHTQQSARHMVTLSFSAWVQKQFADLAYCEPFYIKEFFTTAKITG